MRKSEPKSDGGRCSAVYYISLNSFEAGKAPAIRVVNGCYLTVLGGGVGENFGVFCAGFKSRCPHGAFPPGEQPRFLALTPLEPPSTTPLSLTPKSGQHISPTQNKCQMAQPRPTSVGCTLLPKFSGFSTLYAISIKTSVVQTMCAYPTSTALNLHSGIHTLLLQHINFMPHKALGSSKQPS